MKKEITIYDLELHESMTVNDMTDFIVTRVAGGWIYETKGAEDLNRPDRDSHFIFIPYHSEFKE